MKRFEAIFFRCQADSFFSSSRSSLLAESPMRIPMALSALASSMLSMAFGADLLIQTNKYHKKSNRTLILIMQPLELR